MRIADGTFLVTGGASLVGSHLADSLLAAGARRIVLADNFEFGRPSTLDHLADEARVHLVKADVTELEPLYTELAGVDGVFAVAGFLTLPMNANPGRGLEVNLAGTYNLLQGCRLQGVRKLVFSSSIAVYGNISGEAAEDTPFDFDGLSPALSMYAASKIAGENLCAWFSARHGVETVRLRYGTIYGARQHDRAVNALAILDTYRRVKAGEPPVLKGSGLDVHDYTYVTDIAEANVAAMASDVTDDVFNTATGRSTSSRDLVATVARAAGYDGQIRSEAETSARISQTAEDFTIDVDRARKELGWEAQVSVTDGVDRLLDWYETTTRK